MKVQVLMSSYNGEKYIEEQIKSILNQQNVEVSLLIRDDGSNDSTQKILSKIMDKRIKCIYEKNIGVKKSFLKLIKMADPDVDYYAFSDQDDIWLNDKLISAIKILSKENQAIPLIYGSPVSIYSNGKVIGEQFICSKLNLGNLLVKNYYPGCTMVFNKRLVNLINAVDFNILSPTPLHDHWLNLVCTACGGKILIDKNPHILYRQHDSNVVGDRTFMQKVKGNGLLGHSDNIRFKICKELNIYYRNLFSHDSLHNIDTVLSYHDGINSKLKLAFNNNIKPFSMIEKLSITLIVLLGKF